MATDNDLRKTRDLLEDSLSSLEAANPDWDKEHPNYDAMKGIKDWLEHPDNKPVQLKTATYIHIADEIQGDFEKVSGLMDKFAERVWPDKMVMLGDLEDAIEAWRRFQIAWFG